MDHDVLRFMYKKFGIEPWEGRRTAADLKRFQGWLDGVNNIKIVSKELLSQRRIQIIGGMRMKIKLTLKQISSNPLHFLIVLTIANRIDDYLLRQDVRTYMFSEGGLEYFGEYKCERLEWNDLRQIDTCLLQNFL